MAKMTVELIKKLYISGKAVYEKEQDLEKAVSNILIEFPGLISESSAKFYIGLVKELLLGKGSTWNQNSDLLVYYVENIYLDYGRAMANNAYNGAIKFAYSKSRAPLIKQLNDLKIKYGFSENIPSDDNLWWPSLEEYNPGITKEQWLELLNNDGIFGPVWLETLAMFYSEKDGATCTAIENKYNKPSRSINPTCMNLAKRIHEITNCPLAKSNDEPERNRYWSILFQGRNATKEESGSWVWKLRNELYNALVEFNIIRFLPESGGTMEGTVLEKVIKALEKIGGKGHYAQIYKAYEEIISQPLTTNNKAAIRGAIERNSSDSEAFTGNDIFYSVEGKGSGIWGLRKYNKTLTTKEIIAAIKNYISSKGFSYEDGLIENFYLSLKSKPFVILAGTSGTGKTRLVKLFAEAIGAKMELVPVRPDWSDSSDLFGHNDIAGNFHPGAIIDFIKDATDNKDKPHILCLDEMNLARVEYYLSDFLSIIETRDINDLGEIGSDPLIKSSYFKQESALEKYGQLYLPENLYVVGTVNMDETTFPFSKKVLDRANTIEFSFVNLISKPSAETEPVKQNLNNQFLKTEYLYLKNCDDEDLIDEVCVSLEEINQILVKANLHIGYRVRDEICFYLLNNKKAELLDENSAFDNEIMQKILPRIQGSSTSIKTVLCELFIKCAGDYTSASGLAVYEQMSSYVETRECRYPNSARKISFMMRRFEEDGFTSYWL